MGTKVKRKDRSPKKDDAGASAATSPAEELDSDGTAASSDAPVPAAESAATGEADEPTTQEPPRKPVSVTASAAEAKRGYVVAKGRAVTTKIGQRGAGQSITAPMLEGGSTTLGFLLQKGAIEAKK